DGLRVTVDPLFQCSRCPSTWRGSVQPTDRAAFFASYRAMIGHYADLAQQAGAWLLVVGSEMTSLQGETGQWRLVAHQARAHFGGRLAYSVNWDAVTSVGFWDSVDVAGVSAYFPLSDDASPSAAALRAAWRDKGWVAQLAGLARQSRRPVLFTEAGYRSAAYATRNPADAQSTELWDDNVQANAYEALLQTFESQPWWAGVVWWDWHVSAAVATDAS